MAVQRLKIRRHYTPVCDLVKTDVYQEVMENFMWSRKTKLEESGHPDIEAQSLPGDYGGNAHRGTRCHSMQSFDGLFHCKISRAGTVLIEDCNRRNCVLVIYSLK